MIGSAVVAQIDTLTKDVTFFIEKVSEIDGEPAIDVEGELTKVSAINDDDYNFEIVEVLGANETADEDLQNELTGRLKRRFDFLRHEDPAVIRARHGL